MNTAIFSLSFGIVSYSQMSGTEGYLINGFVEIGINGQLISIQQLLINKDNRLINDKKC